MFVLDILYVDYTKMQTFNEARYMHLVANLNMQMDKWKTHTGQTESPWVSPAPHANLGDHPHPGERPAGPRMSGKLPVIVAPKK